MSAPRLLLCAPASGGGKTTVTCALLQALVNRGAGPVAFKCGPDYIDPMFHSEIIGAKSRNLDLFFLGRDTARYLLEKNSRGSGLALIEGVMGYYDGIGLSADASAYDLARATGTPAVLVLDGRGRALTAAAAVKGMRDFRPDSGIRGVILNRVSPMLYPRLKEAIEGETGVTVYGYLPNLPGCALESRHLGLVTAAEVAGLREKLSALAAQAEKSVDIDGLLALAASAPALNAPAPALPPPVEGRPRIAVARDKAFCFYYADGLELLEALGAELAEFSPLADEGLPEGACGLYLGGGYPELFAGALAANAPMREAVRAAVAGGLPTVAECGGFLYLNRLLSDGEGRDWPMAGALPGRAANTGRLGRFGYVTLTAQKDGLLGRAGTRLPAHEFHYWDSDAPGSDFRADKPQSSRGWDCAFHTPTLYAGFPHFHFWAAPAAARNFVAAPLCTGGSAMTLDQVIAGITPADTAAMERAKARWDSIAKPLGSLGALEEAVIRIAGMTGSAEVDISKRAVVVMCADNGVVAQGVTQTGQEVTAIVAENMSTGDTSVCAMARSAGAEVVPVDIGTAVPLTGARIVQRCVRRGTADMTQGPAMSRGEAVQAVLTGVEIARELCAGGVRLLATGEMGIGNTTTSSAVAAVLLGQEPVVMTGRGAGLSDAGLQKKIHAIETAVAVNQPDPADVLDVLHKVGGLDIAGLAGVFLGGALCHTPVLVDGFISSVAALVAARLCPACKDYMLGSHASEEPASRLVLSELGLRPFLYAGMRLGEGTGAVAVMPLLDMGLAVYREMATFEDTNIEAYQPLG